MTQRARFEAAYRATSYRVLDGGRLACELRIGRPSPSFDALARASGSTRAVFLTAANPRGEAHPEPANLDRNAALDAALDAGGWTRLEGWGVPDATGWAPEPSRLVLDLPRAAALTLARRFEQVAWVDIELGGPARLVFTEEAGDAPSA